MLFESCKNAAMSTAILRLAVCVSDVMNKVGMSGESMKNVTSQLSFFLSFFLFSSSALHG